MVGWFLLFVENECFVLLRKMLKWYLLWVLVLYCWCRDDWLCVYEGLLEKLLFQWDGLDRVNCVCCQYDLQLVGRCEFVFEYVLQLYYILGKQCVELLFDNDIVDICYWVLLMVDMLLILWWQDGLQVLFLGREMNMLFFLLFVFVFFVLVCIYNQGVFDCVFFVVVWFFFGKFVCFGFLLVFIVFLKFC